MADTNAPGLCIDTFLPQKILVEFKNENFKHKYEILSQIMVVKMKKRDIIKV